MRLGDELSDSQRSDGQRSADSHLDHHHHHHPNGNNNGSNAMALRHYAKWGDVHPLPGTIHRVKLCYRGLTLTRTTFIHTKTQTAPDQEPDVSLAAHHLCGRGGAADNARGGGALLDNLTQRLSLTRIRREGNEVYYRSLLKESGSIFPPRRISLFRESDNAVDELLQSTAAVDDDDDDDAGDLQQQQDEYDPYFLDDPVIKSGKRRRVLQLASYRCTIVPFVRKNEYKKDINNQFFLHHNWIEPQGVTLTGIRKVKLLLLNIALEHHSPIEVSTIAAAVCYFEMLVINKKVTKLNRKVTAAACAVLACKFYESGLSGQHLKTTLRYLFSRVKDKFGVDRRRIIEAEFGIYADLSFSLLVPENTIVMQINRLLALYSITPDEYYSSTWSLTKVNLVDDYAAFI
eukprot:PhM_4_TR4083/c0_g1_i1/m.35172